ncbi:hypothetical protein [Streptomyces fuscigenes]|uniref:hypothetical protein n=1 Tax=Streptomyces fuscigenes TaxID=1528880 RepID=UPI001F27D0F1|nr:hypothetical protein [Streptomyces fuscigenes]MCF3960338.1 hypothetical protein [Streptomyces fuscigenes]
MWVPGGTYGSFASAADAARLVPRAERLLAYAPRGSVEAYAANTLEGACVWVRSTDGGPYPPMPARMTVRLLVTALADAPGVLTVSIYPTCPRCGGPRGWDRVQAVLREADRERFVVDRWHNRCGHEDTHARVLEEARRTPPLMDPVASRGRGHHAAVPARAGVFQAAVELILQTAAQERGMTGKQAVALLRVNGHAEAASLLDAKLRADHSRMGAKSGAHFLTVVGAQAAAATDRQEANA